MFLNLDFINDRCIRKVSKLIKKYEMPVKAVYKPASWLSSCLSGRQYVQKHEDCEVCNRMPNRYGCEDRFLVYKLSCKICKKFYVGQTSRPFHFRYDVHRRSLNNKDNRSAISELVNNEHCDVGMTISDFDLQIMKKEKSPIDCKLAEAECINFHRPQLNRKEELTHW